VLSVPVVPWADPDAALRQLRTGIRSLAERPGPRPRVAWCAGAGVTGTPTHVLEAELGVLRRFLEELGRLEPGTLDALFFASSAGGVYAGSVEPPFTEDHPVVPISPYGYAKVAAEAAVTQFARETGVPTVIGRIANLYGAGQDLGKAQGLVSHICRSYLTAQPVSVYVSLDTLRDYLYVSDCAALVVDLLDECSNGPGDPDGSATVKICASQRATTVGALLGECRRIFKKPPLVVLASSPTARYQPRDLRLRSTVWTHLDRRPVTPLPAGMHATLAGMLRSAQADLLPRAVTSTS
jgi:UDP-glucose 4-epimerase